MDNSERTNYFLPLVCFSVNESSKHLPFFYACKHALWITARKQHFSREQNCQLLSHPAIYFRQIKYKKIYSNCLCIYMNKKIVSKLSFLPI